MGSVNEHVVVVLINGGSTHNFVQGRMVPFLNLVAQHTKRLTIMVGNDNEIGCDHVCRNVSVLIQSY